MMMKKTTNQIAHSLQKITAQPCLQILPLPPMLPQIQNKDLLPPKTTITPAPATRVELVAQPLRVQTRESAPTSPTMVKPSTPPSLDPHLNPWIKKFTKSKKIPQILITKKNQAPPRKV